MLYLFTIEIKLRDDFPCFCSKMCIRTFSAVPLNSTIGLHLYSKQCIHAWYCAIRADDAVFVEIILLYLMTIVRIHFRDRVIKRLKHHLPTNAHRNLFSPRSINALSRFAVSRLHVLMELERNLRMHLSKSHVSAPVIGCLFGASIFIRGALNHESPMRRDLRQLKQRRLHRITVHLIVPII